MSKFSVFNQVNKRLSLTMLVGMFHRYIFIKIDGLRIFDTGGKKARRCRNALPVATIGHWWLLSPVVVVHRYLAIICRLFSVSLTIVLNGLCCTLEIDTEFNSPFAQLTALVRKFLNVTCVFNYF